MSGYSRRSLSKASTCCIRRLHCWSAGAETERFVPRRQLQRACSRVGRKRDAKHLEHDALHVVLGLLFVRPRELTCTP